MSAMSVRSWYGLTLKQVVVRVLADRVARQAAAPFAIWREADTHSHSHIGMMACDVNYFVWRCWECRCNLSGYGEDMNGGHK
jgi:hypothetical protein